MKKYESPDMEVIEFEVEDVLTDSCPLDVHHDACGLDNYTICDLDLD